MTHMHRILNGWLHFFYPDLCEGCHRLLVEGERVLCIECLTLLPCTDHHHISDNSTSNRIAGRFRFDMATSFAWFYQDGLLQHLLHRLKYEDRKDIGVFLGKLFGRSLRLSGYGEKVDLIIPVPLHRRKELRRGFNQSTLIAQGLSEALGLPIVTNALIRVRDTDSQTKKTRIERLENVQNAFQLRSVSGLNGKRLLLIDDVLTTGATLEACAHQLLAAVPDCRINIATIGIASD